MCTFLRLCLQSSCPVLSDNKDHRLGWHLTHTSVAYVIAYPAH